MAKTPFIIVVQGGPGVGKTTLARRISDDLNIGLLAKDDIKELLFDRLGLPVDRDQSRVYGRATMEAFFAIAQQLSTEGISLILESAFHKGISEEDINSLVSVSKAKILQVYCHADRDTQVSRIRARVADGSRHPGHLDFDNHPDFDKYDALYSALSGFQTIDVDTTDFGETEYRSLLKQISSVLANNSDTTPNSAVVKS